MAISKYTLEEVNKMDFLEFSEQFGSVVYGTLAATTVWIARPFNSFSALHEKFVYFLQVLSPDVKEGLIRMHPDLTGKLIELKKLSKHSQSEQRSAYLHAMSNEETQELEQLNNRYKTKFCFTFIICVRENTKDSIFRSFRTRLENGRMEEIEQAVDEIGKIAYYRLLELVQPVNSKL